MSLALEIFVAHENVLITNRIAHKYNRAPLQGELIDLTNAGSRTKLRIHIESMLEDEVLHQDGERDPEEARKEYLYLNKLLKELEKYSAKKDKHAK